MTTAYLDRNVDVKQLDQKIKDTLGELTVKFIQWPLEGKSRRIKTYGLPGGDITWDDLSKIPLSLSGPTWQDLNFCTWGDFNPTEKYEQIIAIIGSKNRADCIHFDIAIKNNCKFFLTSDNHFLTKKDELEAISTIQIYDPANTEDVNRFLTALKAPPKQ